MVLRKVQYDLGLEDSHRDSIEQQFLSDGEYGGLFKACSPQCLLAYGVHEDVCGSIDEDAQAVCLEGVTGETVTVHPFLELAYEQLVASASTVGLLVQVLLHRASDIGHYEPDVEFSLLSILRLDRDPLVETPCGGLVVELSVSPHRVMEQLVVASNPLYRSLRDRMVLQHAVPCQAGDEQHLAVVQGGPVHQLVGAEMTVAA